MQRKLKDELSVNANAELTQNDMAVEDEESPIEKLPTEAVFEITKYLDFFSLFSFSKTNKRHHVIALKTFDQGSDVLFEPVTRIWHERIKRLIQLFAGYYRIWLNEDLSCVSELRLPYLKLRAYIENLQKKKIPDKILTKLIMDYFSKESIKSMILEQSHWEFMATSVATDFHAYIKEYLQKEKILSLDLVLNYFINTAKNPHKDNGDLEVRKLLYEYPEANRENLWADRFVCEYEEQDKLKAERYESYNPDPCSIS